MTYREDMDPHSEIHRIKEKDRCFNMTEIKYDHENAVKEIYFAAGCFWGTEKLFQDLDGVLDAESGYANGRADIVPDYKRVCAGDTDYRETVKVLYDPAQVSLEQLLQAYFYVVDPTVENRQGADVGTQYQTGIYYTDEDSGEIVRAYTKMEAPKHPAFLVEIGPLARFYPAEEYHQNYLDKNPGGYCHIPSWEFQEVKALIGQK